MAKAGLRRLHVTSEERISSRFRGLQRVLERLPGPSEEFQVSFKAFQENSLREASFGLRDFRGNFMGI